MNMKLGFNIDHVATLRNAREEGYPNLLRAAYEGINAGASHITAHLREDRRHIKDNDIFVLKENLHVPLNLEIAPTLEMLEIALKVQPYTVCIVPERRNELTTEGGINIIKFKEAILEFIRSISAHKIKVTLFLDPIEEQISCALKLPIDAIEINTAKYSNLYSEFLRNKNNELYLKEVENIKNVANLINKHGLEVHAGHGLNYDNINEIAKIKPINEFNIGHFLVSESIFLGLNKSISKMLELIKYAKK